MSAVSYEKNLMRELEETKEQAVQFERTARWWNESCVKWREKWGKENTEKKKLIDEVEMLNGRNRALIIEFQRIQAENSKLNIMLQNRDNNNNVINQNIHQPLVEKQTPAFQTSQVPRDEDEKRVARVEPIVEEVRLAKTINNESPTPPERPRLTPDNMKVLNNRYLSPLSDIEEQLDSLDLVDGAMCGGDKKYDVLLYSFLNENIFPSKISIWDLFV